MTFVFTEKKAHGVTARASSRRRFHLLIMMNLPPRLALMLILLFSAGQSGSHGVKWIRHCRMARFDPGQCISRYVYHSGDRQALCVLFMGPEEDGAGCIGYSQLGEDLHEVGE
jgi:hypothetical protein